MNEKLSIPIKIIGSLSSSSMLDNFRSDYKSTSNFCSVSLIQTRGNPKDFPTFVGRNQPIKTMPRIGWKSPPLSVLLSCVLAKRLTYRKQNPKLHSALPAQRQQPPNHLIYLRRNQSKEWKAQIASPSGNCSNLCLLSQKK